MDDILTPLVPWCGSDLKHSLGVLMYVRVVVRPGVLLFRFIIYVVEKLHLLNKTRESMLEDASFVYISL